MKTLNLFDLVHVSDIVHTLVTADDTQLFRLHSFELRLGTSPYETRNNSTTRQNTHCTLYTLRRVVTEEIHVL
jgi:hypothetical protein